MKAKEILSRLTDKHLKKQLDVSLDVIKNSSKEALRDVDYLSKVLSQTTLAHGSSISSFKMGYHPYACVLSPEELAYALIELSHHNIRSFAEIGGHMGATTTLIVAYLKKLYDDLEVYIIDQNLQKKSLTDLATITKLEHIDDVDMFKKLCSTIDLSFISHTEDYATLQSLYRMISNQSRICMFHHIHHGYQLANFNLSTKKQSIGVRKLWEEVKDQTKDKAHIFEYSFSGNQEVSRGIGVQIRT